MATRTKPVKHWDYERLLWNGSGLNSTELLIALYLLRLTRTDADEDGWVTATQSAIAKACKLNRETVGIHIAGVVDKGWTQLRKPVEDGHYLARRYRISQPLRAMKPVQSRVGNSDREPVDNSPSRVGFSGTENPAESVGNSDNVLRSKYIEASTTTQPAAEEEETPRESNFPHPSAPPRRGVATDAEVLEQLDEQRRDEQTEQLAYPTQPTDYLAAHCSECGAQPGQDCLGLPAPARPRLDPIRGRPRMHFARIAPSLAARAGVAS